MADMILSTKHAILSSGGSRYNDLYYSIMNSSVSLLECTFQYNQIISLPSVQFGSTSQINIPNDAFIDAVILHLRLPAVQVNETLCRGWGYNILSNIAFTMGSSNSTQIMLQGDSILQVLLGQCQDPEKRLELLNCGGQERIAVEVVPPGEDPTYNDAYVVVPLPFSTVCDKLPIDSTMLQNNINIQIQFKSDPRCIYGGTATHPTSFSVAETMFRLGRLSDQSKSVRAAMVSDPMLKYSYPFMHYQNFITPSFLGVRESDNSIVQLDLNTFANADLTSIVFWVVKDEDKTPTGNNSPNPWNFDEVSNIRLEFAGQTLFHYPYKSYKLTNMLCGGEQSASYTPVSVINPGTVNPFVSFPKNGYAINFEFSRLKSNCFHSHFFNTWRLTNQTLRLSFNTSQSSGIRYRAYCSYIYNGIIEFSNGTSAIYID